MTKSLFVLLLACASAANADIWHNGDLTTYTQGDWGGDPGVDPGAARLVALRAVASPSRQRCNRPVTSVAIRLPVIGLAHARL
jgi:hypothetical protein